MRCRRQRCERGPGPGPGRRQPAPHNAPHAPAAGARHLATGTARAVRQAAGKRAAARAAIRSCQAGHLAAGRAHVPGGLQSCRPKGGGADCRLKPAPLHLTEDSRPCGPRQEGRHSHFMWSEPPPWKKPQFLDKQKKNDWQPTPPKGRPAPRARDAGAQGRAFGQKLYAPIR